MRAAVIGAGAMGSIATLMLAEAGVRVVIYERRQERLEDVRKNGIRITGGLNGEVFPETGVMGEAAAPFDAVVLAVSAGASGEALRPLSPFVHRDTVYISLQEGSAVSVLAELVGEDRAFAAVAWVSAVEAPSGEVEVEGFRTIVLGGLVPGGDTPFERIAREVEAANPGRLTLTDDVVGEMWKRMEAAAAVSGMCTIAGVLPREARKREDLDRLCEEAAGECRLAAASAGRDMPAGASPWDAAVWSGVKPPMLGDVEAGRRTEISFLSGTVVERARALGAAAYVHGAALTLVREIESGRHCPGEDAVSEFKRRILEEKGMSLL